MNNSEIGWMKYIKYLKNKKIFQQLQSIAKKKNHEYEYIADIVNRRLNRL